MRQRLLTIALILPVLLLLQVELVHAADNAGPPNVLMIAVDDLNDWVGCLDGHPQARTPNMDRLAKRGVLFANAHCAAPVCNASRSAVFTGRMPHVTGIWSNKQRLTRIDPQARLLPEALAESGYVTLGTGKLLHRGGQDKFHQYFDVHQRWSPLSKGAVKYAPEELSSKGTDNPRHITFDSQGRQVVLPLNRIPSDRKPNDSDGESFDWGGFDVPDSDFGDTQITDWAIDKLEAGFDKPFFLAVGYYRPHIPLWAPQRYFERFAEQPGQLPPVKRDDLDDLSDTARRWAIEPVTAGSHATVVRHGQWQEAVEAYLACVSYVDHEIGRLLEALDASQFRDNTVVVLWSDHGWHLGEKQHWGKWTGWERSTRVPLIVAPPRENAGNVAIGRNCDQPVGLIDLYTTVLELCDAKGPTELDGESLVPLLHEPDRETGRSVITAFDSGNNSLRDARWRYLRYADGSDELYDLQADPHEWNNLSRSAEHAGVKQKLAASLDRRLAELQP